MVPRDLAFLNRETIPIEQRIRLLSHYRTHIGQMGKLNAEDKKLYAEAETVLRDLRKR